MNWVEGASVDLWKIIFKNLDVIDYISAISVCKHFQKCKDTTFYNQMKTNILHERKRKNASNLFFTTMKEINHPFMNQFVKKFGKIFETETIKDVLVDLGFYIQKKSLTISNSLYFSRRKRLVFFAFTI